MGAVLRISMAESECSRGIYRAWLTQLCPLLCFNAPPSSCWSITSVSLRGDVVAGHSDPARDSHGLVIEILSTDPRNMERKERVVLETILVGMLGAVMVAMVVFAIDDATERNRPFDVRVLVPEPRVNLEPEPRWQALEEEEESVDEKKAA